MAYNLHQTLSLDSTLSKLGGEKPLPPIIHSFLPQTAFSKCTCELHGELHIGSTRFTQPANSRNGVATTSFFVRVNLISNAQTEKS